MARLPRLSVAGLPHLLVQRSHRQQPVFLDDTDRALFRAWLGEAARAEQVAVHAYGLFDREVRMLATPATPEALGRMMQALGRRYGGAFNRRHQRSGGLWEGRFRATVLEAERHLLDAMAYVEEEAGLHVVPGEGAPATSRAHHLGQQHDPLLTDHRLFWALGNTPFDREAAYQARLMQGLPGATRERMERAVQQGWPLGDEGFVSQLAAKTTRRLVPLKRGRPRKVSPTA